MKKSLIALAALAATSAFAQSTVTLYGRAEAGVDLGFRVTTSGTNNGFSVVGGTVVPLSPFSVATGTTTDKPGFRVQDGQSQGQGSSRFGFRGTEDLGGGLKANFSMEAGVNLDDGSANNGGGNFFSRATWVGLSGGFGEVRLGRQGLGSFGVHANGLVGTASNGLYESGANIAQGGVRFANALQYRSPNFGGISGTISLRAPENTSAVEIVTPAGLVADTNSGVPAVPAVPGTVVAGTLPGTFVFTAPVAAVAVNPKNKVGVDLSIEYANGPIYVGFGYNRIQQSTAFSNNEVGGISANTDNKITDYAISASYNFGVAQPFFSYVNRKNVSSSNSVNGTTFTSGALAGFAPTGTAAAGTAGANSKTRQYTLGVKVPLGAASLLAAYGNAKTTGSGSTNNNAGLVSANDIEGKIRAFNIGAQYPLSKRTMLQANYGVNNTKTATQTRTINSGVNNFTAAGTTGEIKVRGLNIGVQHLF